MNIIEIQKKIISEKIKLKNKSKNYLSNFKNIEKYIKKEVEIIKSFENSIIPEIEFKNILIENERTINQRVLKRGCVIIRNVFGKKKMKDLNKNLDQQVLENNYFEDQKKKIGIDKYFSELKSGKPQIFGLYWSKAQSEIRHSQEMEKVKKWLNNLWNYKYKDKSVFDPNKELVYADRVRRREPGDDTLGLSPHCDAGSIERWTDNAYQKIYNDIFSDNFENYNPFDAKYRDETIEFESPAVAHVFRTFQGWTALTEQGPNDGTLQLIPIAKGMAYILTRALLDDVPENELCGSKAGKAFRDAMNKVGAELTYKTLTVHSVGVDMGGVTAESPVGLFWDLNVTNPAEFVPMWVEFSKNMEDESWNKMSAYGLQTHYLGNAGNGPSHNVWASFKSTQDALEFLDGMYASKEFAEYSAKAREHRRFIRSYMTTSLKMYNPD